MTRGLILCAAAFVRERLKAVLLLQAKLLFGDAVARQCPVFDHASLTQVLSNRDWSAAN